MQKVVGSSPIIRSTEGPGNGPFLWGEGPPNPMWLIKTERAAQFDLSGTLR
jgi:hypothetical protein